jgi:hypothetical protein
MPAFQNSIIDMMKKVTKEKNSPKYQYGEYLNDLDTDIELFQKLLSLSCLIFESSKDLALLKEIENNRCIIFTEYIDTADSIYDTICKAKSSKHLKAKLFNGNSSDKDLEEIRLNFDANIPEADRLHTIDVLITTDILSEGVNLHVCNKLIHYDTKWNPSKIKQRNGRIDRILMTGVHRNIEIVYFEVPYLVESILKLEKAINRKLFMGDMFFEYLSPLPVQVIKEFEENHVLYYPTAKEVGYYNVVEVYNGHLIFKDHHFTHDFNNTVQLDLPSIFQVSKVPDSIGFFNGRFLSYFKHADLANLLYSDTFKLILETEYEYEQNVENRVVKMIAKYNLNSPAIKTCKLWLKKHQYTNWENKF